MVNTVNTWPMALSSLPAGPLDSRVAHPTSHIRAGATPDCGV